MMIYNPKEWFSDSRSVKGSALSASLVLMLLASCSIPQRGSPVSQMSYNARRQSMADAVAEDVGRQMQQMRPSNGAFTVVILPPQVSNDYRPVVEGDRWRELVEGAFLRSSDFKLIDANFALMALREAGIADVEQLQLPKYRRQFLQQLEGGGATPDHLVFSGASGSFSSQRSGLFGEFTVNELRQALQLRVVNAESGQLIARSSGSTWVVWNGPGDKPDPQFGTETDAGSELPGGSTDTYANPRRR